MEVKLHRTRAKGKWATPYTSEFLGELVTAAARVSSLREGPTGSSI